MIVDRLLTDAYNKDFIALVQLRGTFTTKSNGPYDFLFVKPFIS
jgi:hypothetical protein